jgi:Photosynthetic reaction centre cytochrome C subunit
VQESNVGRVRIFRSCGRRFACAHCSFRGASNEDALYCICPCFVVFSSNARDADRQSQRVKTASEVFKNVLILKDVPEDKWYDTMAFFAESLGVTCNRCHTAEFAKDDGNQSKLAARKMIRMVDEINQRNFGGQVVVTCNTRHRGTLKPQRAPVPNMEHWTETAEVDTPLPPAADLVARYRRVVNGGSRKGSVTQTVSLENETFNGKGAGRRSTVAVLVGGADKIRMTEQDSKSTTTFVKNCQKGWIHDSRGWRAMDEDDADTLNTRAGNLDADLVGELTSPKRSREIVFMGRRLTSFRSIRRTAGSGFISM